VAGAGGSVAWDELFDRLPPGQRNRILAAADRGVIPADQVPPPPAAPPPHLLHRLLAGEGLDDLTPFEISDTPALPDELDASLKAAIALGLNTPDIALIESRSGSDRDKVTVEILFEAIRRGERVLLVAAKSATLDRFLERLADRPEVCCLRCVGRGEKESELPPAVAGWTRAGHTRRLTEQAKGRSQARLAAAIETCRRRDAEAGVYDHLVDLAEQRDRMLAKRAEFLVLREGIPAAVEANLVTPTDAERDRIETLARCDVDLATCQREAAGACQAVADLEKARIALRQFAAARSSGKWWTPAWWRARLAGDVTGRLTDANTKHRQAEQHAAAIAQEVEQIIQTKSELAAQRDRDSEIRRQTEIDRRCAELNDKQLAYDRELVVLADKWRQAIGQVSVHGARPEAFTAPAAVAAREAWGRLRDADRRERDSGRAWADGLEPLLETLPSRYFETVNLVAGTPAVLATDPQFGDGRRGPFDLLIALEASALSDGNLLSASRRARRWVLIGEPTAPENNRNGSGRAPRSAISSRASGRGGFDRLWSLLHCDPWGREGERVVCRLRPVSAADRGRLTREPVVDRPEVELRIHMPPAGVPELAEVAFPRGVPLARAIEYVFSELGQLPTCECNERLQIGFDGSPGAAGARADLGGGIRATITTTARGCELLTVEFDRSRWNGDRAAEWARRHVVRCGPRRSVRLGALP
jgi:hypothetical protein